MTSVGKRSLSDWLFAVMALELVVKHGGAMPDQPMAVW
jgi:hypothetical protein